MSMLCVNFDDLYYNKTMILGIDEAGRGPWAGPLTVGAVVLGGAIIDGIDDSKKLTKRKREQLEPIIQQQAAAWAVGWVSAKELDEIGMSRALQLATRRAVEHIHVPYHEIIIDGTVNFLRDTTKGRYVTTLPKADALVPSVSAASIVAKVARDRYMTELDKAYPAYGFKQHVGYGTAKHRAAIEQFGVMNEHRLSFTPLQKYRSVAEPGATLRPASQSTKTTRQIGTMSETVAANELVRRGHTIVARNWKTKYCEIDIVSQKSDMVYFTEVKHRKNNQSGDGLAAITPKKLAQMRYAAQFYAHVNHLVGVDLRLLAVATTGDEPVVTTVVSI